MKCCRVIKHFLLFAQSKKEIKERSLSLLSKLSMKKKSYFSKRFYQQIILLVKRHVKCK